MKIVEFFHLVLMMIIINKLKIITFNPNKGASRGSAGSVRVASHGRLSMSEDNILLESKAGVHVLRARFWNLPGLELHLS